MNPSGSLYSFLRNWEGIGGKPAYTAYQDSGGTWTAGYGHIDGVDPGTTCTDDIANMWLTTDLAPKAAVVSAAVRVPVTQGEYDALCSFTFNLGAGAFRGSTLLSLVNGANFTSAALQFPRWDRAGGTDNPGLLKRRVAEMHMFLGEPGSYEVTP